MWHMQEMQKRAHDMLSALSILVSFTEKILQPDQFDIPNEVAKVCVVVKTRRKQSAEEDIWTPWKNGYSRKELHSIQKEDPDIGPIIKWKECGSRPDRVELVKNSPTLRHYWYLWDSFLGDHR